MDKSTRSLFKFKWVAIGLITFFWGVSFQVPAHANIAVDFGTRGLWTYNGDSGWTKLTAADAEWLGTYNDKLVGDFGAYGIWEFDGSGWTRISTGNAYNGGNTMIAFDGGLVVDFGASGLWYYKHDDWTRLTTAFPQRLEVYDGKLVVDFGTVGLYEYNGDAWTRLTTGDADNSGNTIVAFLEESSLEPFAPVAADSPPNSAYTIDTSTVTDNVTGLVWQKTDDNTTRTWEQAWDYCTDNIPALPGAGWRLPTAKELISIVDYGTLHPAINTDAFPGTNSSYYWSATTLADYAGDAWYVDFHSGNVLYDDLHIYDKSRPNYVRCVRGVSNRQSLFRNNGNGTVTDLSTGLTWQQHGNGPGGHHVTAAAYCRGLTLAGGCWRLPTIKELSSIVDYRVHSPAVNSNVFPNIDSGSYSVAELREDEWADYINFKYGVVILGALIPASGTICVR